MVRLKTVRRTNPQDPEAPQKYFVTAVAEGKIDLKKITARISKQCTVTRTDCVAVLDAFLDIIVTELADGNKVILDDFGSFSITVRSVGEDAPEDVKVSNVRKAHMRFRPGREFRRMLKGLEYTKAG